MEILRRVFATRGPWWVSMALAAMALPASAGKVFLTVPEALSLAFPECEVERETHYLSKEDLARASKFAKGEVESRIARPYVARRDGKIVGYAYFDTHRVRTMKETLLVVVDPQQRVGRVEVLSFGEPPEYVPSGAFWGQFRGQVLDDQLNIKRGVRGVTGATLTVRAATQATRRVLATHRVVFDLPAPVPAPKPASRLVSR